MKVWLVESGAYEQASVIAAFSTQARAQAFCDATNDRLRAEDYHGLDSWVSAYSEPFEVDEVDSLGEEIQ